MQEQLKYFLEKERLSKHYSLLTGISLLLFLLILILLLVLINIPLAMQQVLIAVMGMVILVAVDAFRKCLEDKNLNDTINIIDNSKKYQTVNTYYEKQNLAEAAKEIQDVLDQLSKTHPPKTESDKEAVATEAAEEIKQNPQLKSRVIKALQTGGKIALTEAINSPLASLVIAAVLDGLSGDEKREADDS